MIGQSPHEDWGSEELRLGRSRPLNSSTYFISSSIQCKPWSCNDDGSLRNVAILDVVPNNIDGLTVVDFKSAEDARAWAQASAVQIQAYVRDRSSEEAERTRLNQERMALRDFADVAARHREAAQSLARQLRPMVSPKAPEPQGRTWLAARLSHVAETLYWYQTSAREAAPDDHRALARLALAAIRALSRGVDARCVFHFLGRASNGRPLEVNRNTATSAPAASVLRLLASVLTRHGPPSLINQGLALSRSRTDGVERNRRLVPHLFSTAWPNLSGGLRWEKNGRRRRPYLRGGGSPGESFAGSSWEVSGEGVVRGLTTTGPEARRSWMYECRCRSCVRTRIRWANREDRRQFSRPCGTQADTGRNPRTAASFPGCSAVRHVLGRPWLREDSAAYATSHRSRRIHCPAMARRVEACPR
jgi:hypothetical protein